MRHKAQKCQLCPVWSPLGGESKWPKMTLFIVPAFYVGFFVLCRILRIMPDAIRLARILVSVTDRPSFSGARRYALPLIVSVL